LRSVANVLMSGIDNHTVAGLIDPYGAQAIDAVTRYWTAHAWNTQLPPLDGVLLGNRLLWLGITAALFVVGFALFRTQREGLKLRGRTRPRTRAPHAVAPSFGKLPRVRMRHDLRSQCRQMFASAGMDIKGMMRGVLFVI